MIDEWKKKEMMMMMMRINQEDRSKAWLTGTAKHVLHLHKGNCSFLAFGCFLPRACGQAVAIDLEKVCQRASRLVFLFYFV